MSDAGMRDAGERRYFFIHLMKTGGGTVWHDIKLNYRRQLVYPDSDESGAGPDEWGVSYYDMERLLSLSPERRDVIRVYTGHFPFVASEMLGFDDMVTFTVLREPVERTISYLKHCQRFHPQHRGRPLIDIYDDGFINPFFIANHQAKVFAITAEDEPETIMDVIDIDDERLDIAKRNLEKVDIVGFNDDFAAFLSQLSAQFGWKVGAAPDMHVGGDDTTVDDVFRERITNDLARDIEFYAFAKQLAAGRHGAGRV
jgi:hypothetical protein